MIVKAANVPKIQLVRAFDAELFPALAAIHRSQNRPISTAGPGDRPGNSADPA